MRAIRCHAYTGPNDLRLEDVADPVPGEGQVLIAVEACGLGFVDGLHVQGKYQVKIPLPFTPGSEAAGRVIALGAGAPAELMGKRVGPLRAPLRQIDREKMDELKRILVDLEVLPRA